MEPQSSYKKAHGFLGLLLWPDTHKTEIQWQWYQVWRLSLVVDWPRWWSKHCQDQSLNSHHSQSTEPHNHQLSQVTNWPFPDLCHRCWHYCHWGLTTMTNCKSGCLSQCHLKVSRPRWSPDQSHPACPAQHQPLVQNYWINHRSHRKKFDRGHCPKLGLSDQRSRPHRFGRGCFWPHVCGQLLPAWLNIYHVHLCLWLGFRLEGLE